MPAFVTLVTSGLAELVYIKTQSFAVQHFDLPWFFGWSAALSLATIPPARFMARFARAPVLQLTVAIALGTVVGCVWSALPFVLFVRAGEAPFYLIWPGAAAVGVASSAVSRTGLQRIVRTTALVGIAAAGPSAFLEAQPYLRGWQELSVVGLRLERPSATLDIVNPASLTPEDIALLHQSGVTGVIAVQAAMGGPVGRPREPQARVLLLSTTPLDGDDVFVSQPDRMEVLLVQSGSSVTMFPSDARLHRFLLRLIPAQRTEGARGIDVFIQRGGSGWSGAGLVTWK